MDRPRYLFQGVMSILCLIGTFANAGDSVGHKLLSLSDFHQAYSQIYVTSDEKGNEYFYGQRKDLRTKYQPGNNALFRFDRAGIEVFPIISARGIRIQLSGQKGTRNISGLSVDPKGERLAVLLSRWHVEDDGRISGEILLVDTVTGDAEKALSDGQRNYGINISPDGRYVAFYSTDPAMDLDPDKAIKHSAGRILDLNTKTVTTCTPHFVDKTSCTFSSPPQWLENDLVLFSTISTDRAVIDENVGMSAVAVYSDIPYCPYVAVARPSTNEVKRLFMPGGHLPPSCVIDRERKRLYFSERSNKRQQIIIRTDYSLDHRSVVADLDPARKVKSMKLENGDLIYAYGSSTFRIPSR